MVIHLLLCSTSSTETLMPQPVDVTSLRHHTQPTKEALHWSLLLSVGLYDMTILKLLENSLYRSRDNHGMARVIQSVSIVGCKHYKGWKVSQTQQSLPSSNYDYQVTVTSRLLYDVEYHAFRFTSIQNRPYELCINKFAISREFKMDC